MLRNMKAEGSYNPPTTLTKQQFLHAAHMERLTVSEDQKSSVRRCIAPRRSLTEQQGSIISSLAAIFVTHPSVTFGERYTIGVLPMSLVTSLCAEDHKVFHSAQENGNPLLQINIVKCSCKGRHEGDGVGVKNTIIFMSVIFTGTVSFVSLVSVLLAAGDAASDGLLSSAEVAEQVPPAPFPIHTKWN